MPFVMPGTAALTATGTLIFVRIDQIISFFVEQGIKDFFYAGADKVFQIVLKPLFSYIMLSDMVLYLL